MALTESDLDGLIEKSDDAKVAAEAVGLRARQLKKSFATQDATAEPLTNAQKAVHIPEFTAWISDLDTANTAIQLIQST